MAEATHTTTAPPGACPTHAEVHEAPPLFQNGVLTFQAHHVGWIVASFFAIVATAVSIWLIIKHLSWYTNRRQQRQIVRLLLMVPIYAIISCGCYFFWNHAIPLSLIRDAYEGIILAAFFYLLLQYLAPTQAEQKEYFRTYKLQKWAWPFGWVKRKPDGLYFLQLMKWAILQYCWVRPLTTFAAIIMNMIGIYCEASWSPRFGSVWILIIVSLSVTVAMYCLIQFYLSISDRIKQHRPILQLFSIKAIIFLMFWQTAFLSALHSFDVIKDTKYMTARDINVGFAALLQTFEMMLFAFLHVSCFSYIPYRKADRSEMTPKGPAFLNAMDFRDFWRETRDGSVYMWRTARGKEAEFEARRRTHFERAMGKSRTVTDVKKELPPEPHPPEDDEDSADEGFSHFNRKPLGAHGRTSSGKPSKKSSGIKQQGSREKKPRAIEIDEEMALPGHERGQRSWWNRMYGRLSGDDPESEIDLARGKRSKGDAIALPLHSSDGKVRAYATGIMDLDEPPPPSLLGKSRASGAVLKSYEIDEKQPFLDWDPSTTQPPRVPDLAESSRRSEVTSPNPQSAKGKGSQISKHQKEDSLLDRIFTRSHESSRGHDVVTDQAADHPGGLPSLFQKPQDVIGAVRGWAMHAVKRPATVEPEPVPKDVPGEKADDLPSIPTPSPSPPRKPSKGKEISPQAVVAPIVAPAQPTPVLHQSLSRARRPSVLIADEAGIIPPIEQPKTKASDRTTTWVQSTMPLAAAGPASRLEATQFGTNVNRVTAEPVSFPGYNSRSVKGPRKPQRLVMPTPLSPARYPGGQPSQPAFGILSSMGTHFSNIPNPHALPPGAGYGPAHHPRPAPVSARVINASFVSPAMQGRTAEPYEDFNVISPTFVPPQQPRQPRSQFRDQQQTESRRQGVRPDRKRSTSPFGIQPALSDSESLPRHPALRQHATRRRRQSQPLPQTPGSARPTKRPNSGGPPEAAPRQRPGPLHSTSYNADVSISPSVATANLKSPSSPSSPHSPNGDTRYPRATSRSNYFDAYDTVDPYLTNIHDVLPPNVPPKPSSSSPVRRLLRR